MANQGKRHLEESLEKSLYCPSFLRRQESSLACVRSTQKRWSGVLRTPFLLDPSLRWDDGGLSRFPEVMASIRGACIGCLVTYVGASSTQVAVAVFRGSRAAARPAHADMGLGYAGNRSDRPLRRQARRGAHQ